MGKLGVGGTEKGKEERSRNYWWLLPKLFPLHQDVSWWVLSLPFLCCCFSGSLAVGKWLSKCISFLFMLFKTWHLESFLKEASSLLLGSPLPEQCRERRTQSPDRVRSLPPSHMQIRALGWEDISLNYFQFSVRFAYKIQCDLQEKKAKLGSSAEQMQRVQRETIVRWCMVQNVAC